MKLFTLHTTVTDPRARGREIGATYPRQIQDIAARYLRRFAELGIKDQDIRGIALRSQDALAGWYPSLVEESDGIAGAADVEPWQLAAVAARTEILAGLPQTGECSTAVFVPPIGAPETIQTWDWHEALTPEALLLSLRTSGGRAVKLFTEFGIPAKIGVNSAGLGLHFNILRHRSDNTAGGVPVHAIARRVLEEATTVDEAYEIARSAKVSASTVVTVVTYADGRGQAASIEMSPAGVARVEPGSDGWLLHTNHFLDPTLAVGDASEPEVFSVERYEHTRHVSPSMAGRTSRERAAAFCGPAGADAAVCVRPNPNELPGDQWGTLLTASVSTLDFAIDYFPGFPDAAAREGLERF